MIQGKRQCPLCGEKRPLAEFSALTRFQFPRADESFPRTCAWCYWKLLVTHTLGYQRQGKHLVPQWSLRDNPRIEYIEKAIQYIPQRLNNDKVMEMFAGSSIEAQLRPFRALAAQFEDEK